MCAVVTEIKRDKCHTVKVFTDKRPPFLVNIDLATQICLKAGDVLTDEKIEDILYQSDYTRAKSRAFWYLDRSDHTEKALYGKLIKAGYCEKACAEVLARLIELGLINDEKFGIRFAERCLSSGVSKRETYAKMYAKGFPKELIREILDETEVDEVLQVKLVISKKYAKKLAAGLDEKKVCGALMRKGFSFSSVKTALKEFGYCEE